MTKQIRIENADLATFPVRIVYERKDQHGSWITESEHDLSNPTGLFTGFVTSSRRIVVEEAKHGDPHSGSSQAPAMPSPAEVDAMVNRFLAWPVPATFFPDGGISYAPIPGSQPTGTNLLSAEQAKAMILHILGG